MDKIKLKNVVEAILLASDRILSLSHLEKMLNGRSADNSATTESKTTVDVAANDTVHTDQAVTAEPVADSESEPVSDTDAQKEPAQTEEPAPQDQNSNELPSLKRSIIEVIASLQADYAGRAMELKEVASGYRFQVRQGYADYVGKLWEEKPSKYSRALLETLVLIAYRQPITRGEIEAIRGVSVSSHIIKTLVEREWVRVIGHRDVPGKPAIYGSTREFLDYFNLTSLDELPSLEEIKDLDKIAPELALDEKTEEVAASLSNEAGVSGGENQSEEVTASIVNSQRKIEVRRMRRIRRSNLLNN